METNDFKELLISKGRIMKQKLFMKEEYAIYYKIFLEDNLVCPECKRPIEVIMQQQEIRCSVCQKTYLLKDGIPCFIPDGLNSKQQGEFDSLVRLLDRYDLERSKFRKEDLWELIDPNTVNNETRIIVIGGSYYDNLPHVHTPYKWNIDHLAHKFPELSLPKECLPYSTLHMAGKTEQLPFPDNYADIVYSRNSLDHVDKPIRTLIEINRVLKPTGKFYLAVFYNSKFDDSGESVVINDDFIRNYLSNMFRVEYIKVLPLEASSMGGAHYKPSYFYLPNGAQTGWLNAVYSKRVEYTPYAKEDIVQQEKLIRNFESALYWDSVGDNDVEPMRKAIEFYCVVLGCKPLDKTDRMRQLYSRIRYLSLSNHWAFRQFFKEFSAENRDPWWWKLVIVSSLHFMGPLLVREINRTFTGRKRQYLLSHIEDSSSHPKLWQLIRRHTIFFLIAESLYPIYYWLRKSIK